MFIRIKKSGDRTYYYLVAGERQGKKVRQKVIKYLGTQKPAIIKDRYLDLATGNIETRLILDVPNMDVEVIDGKLVLNEGRNPTLNLNPAPHPVGAFRGHWLLR